MERKIVINIVYICILFSVFVFPNQLFAATLSFSPVSSTVELGDTITVRVMVSSGSSINAISGVALIPTSLFSIESVSKSGSVLNFWVSEPNFSKGAGSLSFEGVALGGFSGGTGSVVTVVLRATSIGSGSLTFSSGQVLANDGQGTNVTSGLDKAVFSVVPKKEKPVEVPVVKPKEPQEDVVEEIKEEISVQELSLRAPEIILSNRSGERIILGSSDYKSAQVLLTFIADTGVKVLVLGSTDDKGEFSLVVPNTLKRGEYTVSAVVIQEDLTYSPPSNELRIKLGNLISDISLEVKIFFAGLILSIVYLLARISSVYLKSKKLKDHIQKEAEQAEDIVHRSFKVLSDDIKSGSKIAGDKKILRDLKEDLLDAEEVISKEIKDIKKAK